MDEILKLFRYDRDALKAFPFLHHFISDAEMASENYFVGPKTHNRICSHTEAVFQMLDRIVSEVSLCKIVVTAKLVPFKLHVITSIVIKIIILNFFLSAGI